MPPRSDHDTLVLLGVRLCSFGPAAQVARAAGLGEDEVAPLLAALADRGLARFRDGRTSGWMLTPGGRSEGERLLAAELDDLGLRNRVLGAYQGFLAVNQRLLDACTDWQLRSVDGEDTINDHGDALHDAGVIGELAAIDSAVQPVLAELAGCLERFGGYGPRLSSALTRVRAGQGEWFTSPTIGSYHTVWFEFHENLLATLGIERGSEVPMQTEKANG